MSQRISLKDAERRMFRSTLDDGVVDMVIGCCLLIFVVAPLLSDAGLGDFWSSFVFLPFNGLVMLAAFIVKRTVVAQRLGTVKFGPARQTRMRKSVWTLFVILLVGFGLGLLSFLGGAAGPWVHLARFGLVVLAGFSTAAYFLDCGRLYSYGVMVAVGPVAAEGLAAGLGAVRDGLPITLRVISHIAAVHHGFPVTFGAICAIITVNGVRLFVSFLCSHPLLTEQPLQEGTSNG